MQFSTACGSRSFFILLSSLLGLLLLVFTLIGVTDLSTTSTHGLFSHCTVGAYNCTQEDKAGLLTCKGLVLGSLITISISVVYECLWLCCVCIPIASLMISRALLILGALSGLVGIIASYNYLPDRHPGDNTYAEDNVRIVVLSIFVCIAVLAIALTIVCECCRERISFVLNGNHFPASQIMFESQKYARICGSNIAQAFSRARETVREAVASLCQRSGSIDLLQELDGASRDLSLSPREIGRQLRRDRRRNRDVARGDATRQHRGYTPVVQADSVSRNELPVYISLGPRHPLDLLPISEEPEELHNEADIDTPAKEQETSFSVQNPSRRVTFAKRSETRSRRDPSKKRTVKTGIRSNVSEADQTRDSDRVEKTESLAKDDTGYCMSEMPSSSTGNPDHSPAQSLSKAATDVTCTQRQDLSSKDSALHFTAVDQAKTDSGTTCARDTAVEVKEVGPPKENEDQTGSM